MTIVKYSFVAILCLCAAGPAYAKGIKTKFKFDSEDDKTVVIMQVVHPKKTNKPEKTDYTGYFFRTVNLADGSFEKKYLFTSTHEQLLLEGEETKNDQRDYHYVLAKGKPGIYIHHSTGTKKGVREWISCKELGAFIYEFEPGKVNVISTVPNSYEFDGTDFSYEAEALAQLKTNMAPRLERYQNITAEVAYVAPKEVVIFDNNWNQKNGFASKCPAPKKNGFKIQERNSEAADYAIGRKPGSPPM